MKSSATKKLNSAVVIEMKDKFKNDEIKSIKSHEEQSASDQSYFKKALELAQDYFLNSEERVTAWFLLLGILLSVVALVALTSVFSWWTVGFWAALMAKDLALLISSMEIFTLLTVGYVAVTAFKNYLMEDLAIRWRKWLTNKFINKYFSGENNYLDLRRMTGQVDNPGQRIQQNIDSFVDLSLALSFDFLNSALSLIMFVGTLWVVGGALSFVILGASITIPGYLVWLAIIIAAGASLITHLLGGSLADYNKKEVRFEAEFRQELELLNNEAEAIALERGESYYKNSLLNRAQEIYNNAYQTLKIKTILESFQNLYLRISMFVPYILAAPLYFTGLIDMGQLMQVGFAFGEVNFSLNWFVGSYQMLADYKASIDRIIELDQALEADGLKATKKSVSVIEYDSTEQLTIKNLDLAKPSSTQLIMSGLNITLNRGENTVIKGPSGLGKSTLFKAIAATWKYGSGEISVPSYSKVCFLPQRPSLPTDTLRAVLAYPRPVSNYTEEQYIAALRAVGGMDQFIGELDTQDCWSNRFSGGEQQRISFARALLIQPDWLFLDEATASLDEDKEFHVYTMIKKHLKNTTFISIAHRSTVDQFHDRIIYLTPQKKQEVREEQEIKPIEECANEDLDSNFRALGPNMF